jgi:CheY-like chemotaxis protein
MSGHEGARILVVDDVPENVRLLEAVLASRGYDVISATDGRAALELQSRRGRISSCSTS